jgi:hypothetical protein
VVRLLTEMLEVRILPGEPKFFCINQLRSLGRAFGFGPKGWVVRSESGLQVGEGTALFCDQSDVNNRCHKNVIVAAYSWPHPRLLLVAKAENYCRKRWAKVVERSPCNRMLDPFPDVQQSIVVIFLAHFADLIGTRSLQLDFFEYFVL